jgi:hypothetical protein
MSPYAPVWDGVVMVERPDPTRTSHEPLEQPMCAVRSARSSVFDGRRAIVHQMPLDQVRHYFRSDDEDHVFVRAELHGDHLQLYERCSLAEWVQTAHTAPRTTN